MFIVLKKIKHIFVFIKLNENTFKFRVLRFEVLQKKCQKYYNYYRYDKRVVGSRAHLDLRTDQVHIETSHESS